jgi:hypothetical protein
MTQDSVDDSKPRDIQMLKASKLTLLASTALIAVTLVVPASAAPSGSYRQTCRNIEEQYDHTLSAECRTRDDYWVHSEIDASDCDGDIANANGRLVCADNSDRYSSGGEQGDNRGYDSSGDGWRDPNRDNDHPYRDGNYNPRPNDDDYYQNRNDDRRNDILSRSDLARSMARQGYFNVHDMRRINGERDWRALATWHGRRVVLRLNPRTGRVLAARYI